MNEHQRRQQEMADARRKFADGVARGQIAALDRFGNRIDIGDKLMWKNLVDLVFDVVAVNPVMDPRVAPGLMDITLTVTFPIRYNGGVPYDKAVIIAKREPVSIPAGSDNGNQPTGPTLVKPGIGEAGEPAGVQAEGDDPGGPDPEDKEPIT
jgi:hypothetical protein